MYRFCTGVFFVGVCGGGKRGELILILWNLHGGGECTRGQCFKYYRILVYEIAIGEETDRCTSLGWKS